MKKWLAVAAVLSLAVPVLAQETRTIIVKKAAPGEATLVESEDTDKERDVARKEEKRVIVKSIELPDLPDLGGGERGGRRGDLVVGCQRSNAGSVLSRPRDVEPGGWGA